MVRQDINLISLMKKTIAAIKEANIITDEIKNEKRQKSLSDLKYKFDSYGRFNTPILVSGLFIIPHNLKKITVNL